MIVHNKSLHIQIERRARRTWQARTLNNIIGGTMKNIFLILMIFPVFVFAQDPPSILWTEFYGGEYSDSFDCAIETSDGSLLMCGYQKLTQTGCYDVYLIKTDTDGIIEWEHCYPGFQHNEAKKVIETSDGGYLLLVEIDHFGSTPNETWLMKVDSIGNEIWTQEYVGYEDPVDIVETDNNEFILIGNSTYPTPPTAFWILRVDSNGEIIWSQVYEPYFIQLPFPFVCSLINNNNDNSFLFSGYYYYNPFYRAFLIKINDLGEIEWTYTHETNNHNFSTCNIIQDEEEFILCTSFGGNIWLVRIDENGDLVNSVYIESDYNLEGLSEFRFKPNHGFIFLGFIDYANNNGQDFVLIQTSETGEIEWQNNYDLSTWDMPFSLIISDSNDLYVAGINRADTFLFSTDGFLSKFHLENSSINNDLISSNDITDINIFPNPFNPSTKIKINLAESGNIELAIYNMKGQKVKTLTNTGFDKGNHSIIWNGVDESGKPVSSGVYFYKLNVNGKSKAVKKCLLLK
ncbi:MAG: T9SS type A sorting domain-containing protein [Candidatus Cloacimonetes bacterium]|nr:T9SS type A sorting domain-containing protein [Candidatus Cloacimonadota bacterium]